MVTLLPAKNGSLTCSVDNVFLHSRYNPEHEAEKYIQSLCLDESISHFIVIECALGYIHTALRRLFPSAVIVSLHCDDFFVTSKDRIKGDDSACFIDEADTARFLEKTIPEDAYIKIIEWRPSLAVYREKYVSLLKTVTEFLKMHDANKRTAEYFKARWEKNMRRNLAQCTSIISFNELREKLYKKTASLKCPVVIAAAGPTLENSIGEIKAAQKNKNAVIIAVSSALYALYAEGISPDIAVATDGGFWALPHLFALKRNSKEVFPVIAAPLNARLPSFLKSMPVLLYSDGSAHQNELLMNHNIPVFSLPQRGTVSAAALDIAFALSPESTNIYIAGLDLSDTDIKNHARPYSFEMFWREKENRFSPYYSQLYARALLNADSHTNNVYISWFKQNIKLYASKLFALRAIHPELHIPVKKSID